MQDYQEEIRKNTEDLIEAAKLLIFTYMAIKIANHAMKILTKTKEDNNNGLEDLHEERQGQLGAGAGILEEPAGCGAVLSAQHDHLPQAGRNVSEAHVCESGKGE